MVIPRTSLVLGLLLLHGENIANISKKLGILQPFEIFTIITSSGSYHIIYIYSVIYQFLLPDLN